MSSNGNVKNANIIDLVLENYRDYASEIILNRVLPSVVDGLKPSERALMTSFWANSNEFKDMRYKKSDKYCNAVPTDYHPHGAGPIYKIAVDMESSRCNLVESENTLKLRTGDRDTAVRYTNMRPSEWTKQFMSALNIAKFVESPMGSMMPETIPLRYPHQLFIYNNNIGVGVGNVQLPFNPKEIIEATIKMVKDRIAGRTTTTDSLMKIIKGPDLYKGTTIYMSEESLRHLIDFGTGSCMEVVDIEYEDNGNYVIIRELPYNDNTPALQERILRKVNDFHDKAKTIDLCKIEGVEDVKDNIKCYSSEDNIDVRIKVDTKNGYTPEFVAEQLYNKGDLKKHHNIVFLMVDETGKKVDIYSIRSFLERSIEVNLRYFTKIYQDELDKLERQKAINIVLEKLTREGHTEFVGKTFFHSNRKELLLNREGLDLTQDEIDNIVFKEASILRRLNTRDKVLKELEEFEKHKQVILEKLKEENILLDTKEYLEKTIYPMVKDKERLSKIVYSPLSQVTPKPRKVHIPEDRIVYVFNNGDISCKKDSHVMDREGLKKVFVLKDIDSVNLLTETHQVRFDVDDINEDELSLSSYGTSILGLGNRVVDVFPQLSKSREDVIWYFVNNLGEVKSVEERRLMTNKKQAKSTYLGDDETVVYSVPRFKGEKACILLITEKGYAKCVDLDYFNPKNREGRFNRAIVLGNDDSIMYSQCLSAHNRKGNVNITCEFSDGSVEELDIKLSDLFMPIQNKGMKLFSDKKDIAKIKVISFEPELIKRVWDGMDFYDII